MKKSLILCALLWIITSGILVASAFAHNVLSQEPCPSQQFPDEFCFFHVVKKGETASRILARYNSSETTLFTEDLSKIPGNLYILERKRPLRFKRAWDYLLPDDVIVFPFLAQTTLLEAKMEKSTYQLSRQKMRYANLGEQLRYLKEKLNNQWWVLVFHSLFSLFLFAAALLLLTVVRRRMKARKKIIL